MKESRFSPSPAELTRRFNPSTLEVKGDIFMAGEPQGNIHREPQRIKEPPVGRDIDPRLKPSEIQRMWEGAMGRPLSEMPADTRQTVGIAIKEGAMPRMAGGATVMDATSYSDTKLKRIVDEINSEALRVGADGQVESDYVSEQRIRVRQLLDDDKVDETEAQKLIGDLNAWDAEFRAHLAKSQRGYRSHGLPEITKNYKVRELLGDRKKRDEVFNEIFAGVDAAPNKFWSEAFNIFTRGADLEAFMDLIRNGSTGRVEEYGVTDLTLEEISELKDDFQRYQTDEGIRRTLHDVNAVLYLPSVQAADLFKNMQQFSSAMGDYAFRQAGVTEMMSLYEMALREDMVKNNGYLRPEAVTGYIETVTEGDRTTTHVRTGEVEIETKKRFRELLDKRLITVRNSRGEAIPTESMEDWEIDRIFTMARGMTIMTERLISIAAESKLPEGGGAAFTSLFLQDVLQSYAGFTHLLLKYGVTESGLAAYLYKDKRGTDLRDMLGLWSHDDLKKSLHEAEHDRAAFIEKYLTNADALDIPYLLRLNPNKAGDVFTWLSWRAGEKADAITMSQKFIQEGEERMRARMAFKPADISEEDYLSEYGNWIGTGLRFERLRGKLSNFETSNADKRKDFEDARRKAHKLFNKMADIQPHRLYSVSRLIRQRVDGKLTEDQRANIGTILSDLQTVERNLLEKREALLDKGKVFDTLSLEDPDEDFFSVIDDPVRRENARHFARVIREDLGDNPGKYDEEFIYKREYTHGFVLWSGDAPLNEFNASALGPTGGFARRARDNTSQAEALQEEIKLLGSLTHLTSTSQVVGGLRAIYDKVAAYDSDKAKEVIADKAEGIVKFFAADWGTQIPIFGNIMARFRRNSFAQVVGGTGAMAWQPMEARLFLGQLRDAHMLTNEQYKELSEKAFASNVAVTRDFASTAAQLLAIAITLYMIEELRKEKH